MGKYDQLRTRLTIDGRDRVELSFVEIERIVGDLPASAFEHRAWWANEIKGSHVQADAWLSAGYRVDSVDQIGRRVRFIRQVLRELPTKRITAPAIPATASIHTAAPSISNSSQISSWQYATKVNYFRYLHSPEGKAEFRLGFPWISLVVAGLLFVTIVAIPAAIGHGIGMIIRQSMRRKKFEQAVALAKRCEPLFVYPVRVKQILRDYPNQRASGLVMGSFENLDEDYFRNLASLLESIASAPDGALSPVEATVRLALAEDKYVENRRRRLPEELTGGARVYLFDLMIDGRKLIGNRLIATRILCMADTGDVGMIFNIPYHTVQVPESLLTKQASTPSHPADPHITDECFALIDAAGAPAVPEHPVHAVVDDVSTPCPRCTVQLVSLLTLRLDAPELRSISARLPTAGPSTLRIVICEQCCVECLTTFAAYGPSGEILPESVFLHDDVHDRDFRFVPGVIPAPVARRWTRESLRLEPTRRSPTAAIDYALGTGSSHLGGLPRWIQDPAPPSCPGCRSAMPFLAHIYEGELGEGDTDLFVFWCPSCSTTCVVPQQS